MENYEWMEKNGKKILYMRVASKNIEELNTKIEEFREVITRQPEHSLLTISDVTNGHFDKSMKGQLQTFVAANEPYVKMSVIVGLQGLQKIVYDSVLRVTGRKNLVLKNSLEEALAFLSGQ